MYRIGLHLSRASQRQWIALQSRQCKLLQQRMNEILNIIAEAVLLCSALAPPTNVSTDDWPDIGKLSSKLRSVSCVSVGGLVVDMPQDRRQENDYIWVLYACCNDSRQCLGRRRYQVQPHLLVTNITQPYQNQPFEEVRLSLYCIRNQAAVVPVIC